MIKNILVALDGSEHSRSAIEHALWFAERFGASVTGLHVIDIVSIDGSFLHDISGSLGFEPYLDFSSKMREVLQERGRTMLDKAEWIRRHADGLRRMLIGSVTDKVLRGASCPVLVVPAKSQ